MPTLDLGVHGASCFATATHASVAHLLIGRQNKFHRPTAQKANDVLYRAETRAMCTSGNAGIARDHMRARMRSSHGPSRGPCGPPVDRPVDRSVDRCVLIGFVPWTVILFLKLNLF